ncbi:hypothetical protein ABZ281_20170, partial [Streptomyces sp. NPDC006265]
AESTHRTPLHNGQTLPAAALARPVEELTWRPGPFHRALVALPVRFPPSTATLLTVGNEPPVERSAPTPQPSEVPEGGRVRRGWAARLPAWRVIRRGAPEGSGDRWR